MTDSPFTLRDGFTRALRQDFASFIARCFASADPGARFLANWHIDLIAEYLEAARRAEVRRLIINMPPRALKSICVSVAWPAWLLGHDPACRVMAASYAAPLAVKHSIDCRMVMTQGWYKQLFPGTCLTHDQNEKHKFMTTARGYRIATSVGGTVTGEGGNFLILDDPLSALQAESRQEREQANRWFEHSFATRLDDKSKGVIVLVMQRLHAADLSGYLLERGGWEHLNLPALAPRAEVIDFGRVHVLRGEGDALHPAREDTALIAQAKREMGSRAFAAQYQQEPVSEDSALLRAHWFKRHDAPPPTPSRIVQSWDTAIKSGPHHDASCCLTFAEADGVSYLLEALTLRAEYPDLRRAVIEQAERYRPQVILVEEKASGYQLLQDVGKHTPLPLIARKVSDDKLTRVAAASALIEAGRVSLPARAYWLADFEAEVLGFPAASHDDQVDALTQYLLWLREGAGRQVNIRVC